MRRAKIKVDKSTAYRKVISIEKIEKFDLVLERKPIVAFIRKPNFCSSCCIFTNECLLCGNCKFVRYCSTLCQREDWQFHKRVCRIFKENSKLIEREPFICPFIITIVLNYEDNSNFFDDLYYEPFKGGKYEEYMMVANHLFQIFKNSENNYSLEFLEQCVIKHVMNSSTVHDPFNDQIIGNALYETANFFNHSCDANTEQIFEGKSTKYIAIKELPIGSELTVKYISNFLPYSERQVYLRENYLFLCECNLCSTNSLNPKLEETYSSQDLGKLEQYTPGISDVGNNISNLIQIIDTALNLNGHELPMQEYALVAGNLLFGKFLNEFDTPQIGWLRVKYSRILVKVCRYKEALKELRKGIKILDHYYSNSSFYTNVLRNMEIKLSKHLNSQL